MISNDLSGSIIWLPIQLFHIMNSYAAQPTLHCFLPVVHSNIIICKSTAVKVKGSNPVHAVNSCYGRIDLLTISFDVKYFLVPHVVWCSQR